jgi:rhomboid protease GluP
MDFETILFWIVCISCAAGLLRAVPNLRVLGLGWMMVFLLILAVTIAGRWWDFRPAIYGGGALWVILVLVPALLSQLSLRFFLKQRYRAARNVSRIVSWLHPTRGWRQQFEILKALELAQAGDVASAVDILRSHQATHGSADSATMAHLYRLTNQWEEFIAWHEKQAPELRRNSYLIPMLLRAHGEIGDLAGLVNLFFRNEKQIERLEPSIQRHFCRLVLFAFCGRREGVERLFSGALAVLPLSAKELWLATADLAAGRQEEGVRKLSGALPEADPVTQRAIERRLSHPPTIAEEVLSPEAKQVIARAELDQHHEARFDPQPSLFSRWARASQMFIALNVLVFLAEVKLGGSTDIEVLRRMGGLIPEAVSQGEWWRLLAANFLHYGPLHLAMNMLGLWVLGPFVEFSLGFRRFLFVYLMSGLGAMVVALAFMHSEQKSELLVGASACVMGLIGSTGGILLRGWRKDKARIASRRFILVLFLVALQTLIDWMIPQVSMTAHLSGAMTGFLITLLLKHG